MTALHHAQQLIFGGYSVLVEATVRVEGLKVGGIEHIAHLHPLQIAVLVDPGHIDRLTIKRGPALVVGRLQIVDELRPLGGIGEANHQIDLTGLHLLERPAPRHPPYLQLNAARLLQPAQDVHVEPLQPAIRLQDAKWRPQISGHRQRRGRSHRHGK